MIKRIVQKYMSLPKWIQLSLLSLLTIIPPYLSAFLSVYISELIKMNNEKYWFHFFTAVVISIVFISLYRLILYGYNQLQEEKKKKQEVILYAFSQAQRFVTENQEIINSDYKRFIDPNKMAENIMDNFKNLVEKIYSIFEAQYGKSDEIENRINFEVTFMTKSYIDHEITIPAYANREKRAPKSMLKRKTNIEIYDNTVTASIYREENPSLHIIENTDDRKQNYQEIYPGQISRIQSSLVFPILSPDNILLGTLVVHCNSKLFFKQVDFKYWTDLLEIFSKYIGLLKIKLDFLEKYHNIKKF